MSLFVFFISLLIVAQHVSGNHVPIFGYYSDMSVCVDRYVFYLSTCTDRRIWTIPLIVTAQYQHMAITLRSRQLLKMGTWLPETSWATC